MIDFLNLNLGCSWGPSYSLSMVFITAILKIIDHDPGENSELKWGFTQSFLWGLTLSGATDPFFHLPPPATHPLQPGGRPVWATAWCSLCLAMWLPLSVLEVGGAGRPLCRTWLTIPLPTVPPRGNSRGAQVPHRTTYVPASIIACCVYTLFPLNYILYI